MLVVKYLERVEGVLTGREAEIEGREFAPLSWTALFHRRLNEAAPVDLRFLSGEIIRTSIEELPLGMRYELNTDFKSGLTSLHLGLVSGGWLPAGLALSGENLVLPDRCTLSELRGRFKPGRDAAAAGDFVDWFNQAGVRLNPVLLALEGNTRSLPEPQAVRAQMLETVAAFRTLLPLAKVVGDAPDVMESIVALAGQMQSFAEKTIAFLLEIAPVLRDPVSRERLEPVLAKIGVAAGKAGLDLASLPVLCAVSAAAIGKGRNPAKRALKLGDPDYSAEVAFNAMANIRSLQIFTVLLGISAQDRPMLCTGDKDLALIWVGANLSDFEMVDNQARYGANPLPQFLPEPASGLYKEMVAGSRQPVGA